MLRYNKNELKPSAESMHRDRLVEKAIGKFTRKLELMVDSKLPREHILSAAASYGLEVADFTDKISKYLTPATSEPASKVEKKAEKPQPKKKEVKASEPASEEKSEQSDSQ